MPSARANIRAKFIAQIETGAISVARKSTPAEATRPAIVSISGRPAATSEPKASTRIASVTGQEMTSDFSIAFLFASLKSDHMPAAPVRLASTPGRGAVAERPLEVDGGGDHFVRVLGGAGADHRRVPVGGDRDPGPRRDHPGDGRSRRRAAARRAARCGGTPGRRRSVPRSGRRPAARRRRRRRRRGRPVRARRPTRSRLPASRRRKAPSRPAARALRARRRSPPRRRTPSGAAKRKSGRGGRWVRVESSLSSPYDHMLNNFTVVNSRSRTRTRMAMKSPLDVRCRGADRAAVSGACRSDPAAHPRHAAPPRRGPGGRGRPRLLGGSQQNVSKHLAALQSEGFVRRRKQGTSSIYRIADPAVLELCDRLCEAMESQLAELESLLSG